MEKKKNNKKENKKQVLDLINIGSSSRITCKLLPTGAVEIHGELTFAQYLGLEDIPGLAECQGLS